ncbi:tryptophan dimethylallyltransferase family protein [Streptomyces acidiscabies]|uniref:Tryptophan dimethylallyltransferase family protein n=1 Tax=Streptomyces acidiscabies TaxID=42234 RepID=A0AAP6BC48_9ACTN|nr:tryptophan dimethylallyltransferase family protein [Streptomyces acidiscabies]MBP5935809.1 prenyltransferase [Streptomyces sp. LBUM 1476]MBZ3916289.1 prenyltransferase [Streptomyces acidiscabies]MDX2962037.1 tryptophan dimethylallyltransferase family protein [Streptomyces acidiscabies]MDX3017966.1 tryptophan dimethylallyltransferase family protein [Streptomyces acidiscabies]MDX3791261.1 tryptophan dimethylallyltransferase family protein [Streptomyces acidiscabies]
MTATAPRVGDGAPTLGALTVGQLLRLCDISGLAPADAERYAAVLLTALGPVAERPLDLPPPTRTFLSDDHTPVEFSLAHLPGEPPALRVLVEPGCLEPDLAGNGRTGLAVVHELARAWNFSTVQLDALTDLFLPDDPHGPLALWIALELRPGGVPAVKVYLNPSASGPARAAATVREALQRLGHPEAFDSLPDADGYPFLALDLGDWDTPRAKVYLRHDDLTAARAGTLSRTVPGPSAGEVEEFLTLAGGFDEASGDARLHVPLAGRPGLTCHAFTENRTGRPSGFTLHVPVRDYVRHDGDALGRAARALRRHGMDPAGLRRAMGALTSRRPEDGAGLIAYLALVHQQGRPTRITTYLSAEAYEVRAPLVRVPAHGRVLSDM